LRGKKKKGATSAPRRRKKKESVPQKDEGGRGEKPLVGKRAGRKKGVSRDSRRPKVKNGATLS